MKTSDRNTILETPLLRIRQPKPQIMAYSAYATMGKRPEPILQTYKNLGFKISGSKQREIAISGNQAPSSMLTIPQEDSDTLLPSVIVNKEIKPCYSARKHRSFLVTHSQSEDDPRITNGFEISASPDLPNSFDDQIKKLEEERIVQADQCEDDDVFVDPDSLPVTSPKRYGRFLVRVMDGNFNETKQEAIKIYLLEGLSYIDVPPCMSNAPKVIDQGVRPESERKAYSQKITEAKKEKSPIDQKEANTYGDTLQIPQITLPGIKSQGKSKSYRSPSDGDSCQVSTLNTDDSVDSGNDTPSYLSHSIVSNSEKLSRGSGQLESSHQLMRRSFFASTAVSTPGQGEKSSPSPPKLGQEEGQKEQVREKKSHLRHFSDLTSTERLGLTSRHHVHKTLEGIESKTKRSHISKTSTRLHQTVRRNFKALIASTDIAEKKEELKRLNSSSLEYRPKPLSFGEWNKQQSEIEGLTQCPREKMLRVHRLIKIARATQLNRRPFTLSSEKDERICSMVQGWMQGGEQSQKKEKKSKEMEEEETLSKIVSLHNEREQRQKKRPATVRQSSVL